jgi:hypothetical protein
MVLKRCGACNYRVTRAAVPFHISGCWVRMGYIQHLITPFFSERNSVSGRLSVSQHEPTLFLNGVHLSSRLFVPQNPKLLFILFIDDVLVQIAFFVHLTLRKKRIYVPWSKS